jgi:squamous cell carcinoma antigen recognized by T-cells 3
MEENESLEALSNLLTALSENPYELPLHAQHIRLADASGDPEQVITAREMMTAYWPAGDEVWLPLLQAKRQSVRLETAEGIDEMLAMYSAAEDDYFCKKLFTFMTLNPLTWTVAMDLLHNHFQFLVETFDQYFAQNDRPESLGDLFTPDWTRGALSQVMNKSSGDLIQV